MFSLIHARGFMPTRREKQAQTRGARARDPDVELIETKRASQKSEEGKKKHIESPLRLGRGPGGDGARGRRGPGGDPARDCAGGSEGGHCKRAARGGTSELELGKGERKVKREREGAL